MHVFYGVTGFIVAGAVAAVSYAQAPVAPSDAEARRDAADLEVLNRVCAPCHGLEPITMSLKTRDEWDGTFDQMESYGAIATPAEFQQAFDYVMRHHSTINVNRASATDLASWLGVSESLGQAIIDYRTAQGAFKTLDDLKKVPGIQPEKLDARKGRASF
jgi:competence protein ComEA